MAVNDNAFFLSKRVAIETIASRLAPTGGRRSFRSNALPLPSTERRPEQARTYRERVTA
ncbi:hypothetical protein J2W17_000554 [Pseudomonas lini]|nr:hypothetical protein [Pseudomonas lini]